MEGVVDEKKESPVSVTFCIHGKPCFLFTNRK